MTKRDIEQIKWCKKEIEMLEKQIDELRQQSFLGNSIGDGMPHARSTTSKVESTSIKIYELTVKLNERKSALIKLVTEAINFIYSIEDSLLRMIIKYRCIDGLSWQEISDILGIERTTISKKYDAFFKAL